MRLLGAIADDFTGGTDVAAALRRGGLTVTLLFDPPTDRTPVPETDAVVIALKTRTAPVADAVSQSLACLEWLRGHGVDRVYFKYCSTFDSTSQGNIGPVTDALLEALGEQTTVICPASPEHGRTLYQGHLFVFDTLLSESSMATHPLTPMTDPLIPRFLRHQTGGSVGLLPLQVVQGGTDFVATGLEDLAARGVRHVVVDAVSDDDLRTIAAASGGLRLLTGGAGLAGALGHVLAHGTGTSPDGPAALPEGPAVVLAGSCSAATLDQVSQASAEMPAHRLDPVATPDPAAMLDLAATWLRDHLDQAPVLIYSSAPADARDEARTAMGPDTAHHLERTLGALAAEAVDLGAARVVVAGGETSGAVVQALGLASVVVLHEADRGVPWCLATDRPLAVLLKSGNFGRADLLVRAASETGS